MTLLQKEQQAARLRTLSIVIEDGTVRFAPKVHVERDLRPKRHYLFDRMGLKR